MNAVSFIIIISSNWMWNKICIATLSLYSNNNASHSKKFVIKNWAKNKWKKHRRDKKKHTHRNMHTHRERDQNMYCIQAEQLLFFSSHHAARNMLFDVCCLAGLWFDFFSSLKTVLNCIIHSLYAALGLNHWIKDMRAIYEYSRDTFGYHTVHSQPLHCIFGTK